MIKFVNELDILRSSLAIQCAQCLIKLNPKSQENSQVLFQAVKLAGSSQIHGQPIVIQLQDLFIEAQKTGIVSKKEIDDLIAQVSLYQRASAKIAAIIISQDNSYMGEYVNKLFGIIQSDNAPDDDKVRATLTFGEIGQNKDLSKMNGVLEVISK